MCSQYLLYLSTFKTVSTQYLLKYFFLVLASSLPADFKDMHEQKGHGTLERSSVFLALDALSLKIVESFEQINEHGVS